MFEGLSERLGAILKRVSGKGRLGEAEVDAMMAEVRTALLEADVNLAVVKDFVAEIRAQAIGGEVLAALTSAQSVIKIVNDALVALLGAEQARLVHPPAPPTVIMLVGLQGAGKTTHAAKLARHLKENGRRSLLVAADIYRPAAVEQLERLGREIELPVFRRDGSNPVEIARAGLAEARRLGISTVIIDTAGRLQIDAPLMEELVAIKEAVSPHETLLVADAMTGQEATRVASGFHERLSLTGIILTKLDGDTRGGAALSIRKVTGAPIKFIGTGERVDAFEPFYPQRIASRILGMGDMLTLIEKTQRLYTEHEARDLERKIRRQEFTLEDFLTQMRQMRKLGSMTDVLKMLPGVARMAPKIEIDEREVNRVEAMICSMTLRERRQPDILNASRRRRIAVGSGMQVADVNRLVKQFEAARQMMKQMTSRGAKGRSPRQSLPSLFGRS